MRNANSLVFQSPDECGKQIQAIVLNRLSFFSTHHLYHQTSLWSFNGLATRPAPSCPLPPAEDGMVRFVLELPRQEDESSFKVELLVGKMLELDEGNQYFFADTSVFQRSIKFG